MHVGGNACVGDSGLGVSCLGACAAQDIKRRAQRHPACVLDIRMSAQCVLRRILKEERNYILSMIKKIRASGANVLLIQKSILRDAVTDLSLHYLVRCC